MLMPERLPPQEADERGCPEAAEQKPRHPANAHPGEEREPQRAHNAELHPLLREPRRNGIDQLPVEEQHLEQRHGDLYQHHEDDLPDLSSLDRVVEHLDAGEAAGDQDVQEDPQDSHEQHGVHLVARQVRQQLAHRRAKREREDHRLDGGPDDEQEERQPPARSRGEAGAAPRQRAPRRNRRRESNGTPSLASPRSTTTRPRSSSTASTGSSSTAPAGRYRWAVACTGSLFRVGLRTAGGRVPPYDSASLIATRPGLSSAAAVTQVTAGLRLA